MSQPGGAKRLSLLLAVAWASTLLPLAFFLYFTFETYGLRQRAAEADQQFKQVSAATDALNSTKAELEASIKKLDQDLKGKEESNAHYRKLAGIRIRYYRASDAARAQQVAMTLGLDGAELGQSPLVGGIGPNALAYGSDIAESDLVGIALAFLAQGFPLRKLSPAAAVRDAKLIQVIASADAQRSCQLLTETEIRAGVRCGGTSSTAPSIAGAKG